MIIRCRPMRPKEAAQAVSLVASDPVAAPRCGFSARRHSGPSEAPPNLVHVPSDTGDIAWNQAVDSFFSQHLKLVETIKAFTDERLEDIVPGRTHTFYRLFQSTTQHAVYHAAKLHCSRECS